MEKKIQHFKFFFLYFKQIVTEHNRTWNTHNFAPIVTYSEHSWSVSEIMHSLTFALILYNLKVRCHLKLYKMQQLDVSCSIVRGNVFKGCGLFVNVFIHSYFPLTIIFGAVCWAINNDLIFNCVYCKICTDVIFSIDLIMTFFFGLI